MRRVLLALGFLLSLCAGADSQSAVGPPNAILCNNPVQFIGTGALAQIQAAVTGARIFICGWHVTSTSSTTTTFQIEMGTGSNCGTNTAALTPALNVTITAPSADHVDYAQMQTGQSNALCINAPATVNGLIWTNQF